MCRSGMQGNRKNSVNANDSEWTTGDAQLDRGLDGYRGKGLSAHSTRFLIACLFACWLFGNKNMILVS